MARKEAIIIGSAIVAGIAVAGSLFLLYPDMMLRNTGFETQTSGTDVPVLIDPNNPTGTASAGNVTNSTMDTNAIVP